MKKPIITFGCAALMSYACFAQQPIKGYFYGTDEAPGGYEWQCPDSLAYNKELPRATFSHFGSVNSARKVLPENSQYHMSLDGKWKFNWVKSPEQRPVNFFRHDFNTDSWDDIDVPSNWNIAGIQKDGSLKYGTPIYVNQPVIFQHKVAVDDWRGGVMRTPPSNWTTYDARNEVGSYKRSFKIPSNWKGRKVYINFDGVDSFFYLWINGRYVGFSKNSRNAARFDITPYLKKGENSVAVEVYRSSDGSFLESQDMFRLPGIFRSVSLYSTPNIQVRDLVAIPDLTRNYSDGSLSVTASVKNHSDRVAKGMRMVYTLYANKLYDDSNTPVPGIKIWSNPVDINPGEEATVKSKINVIAPALWSAECPMRYTLVGQLVDNKGKALETVSVYTAFRKVEIRDTPASRDEFGLAGRYFYINNKPVKLKGVNRHETSPERGHAVTRDQMLREVMMMKRANINHVRNSHYPDAPYWYYLADKYGIYLEDECNLESHEYYYGKASLSHVPEWEAAHVARQLEMIHSTVNSPSVVIWSLGNEAGPGKNFVSAYNAIKNFDTSRPVQYERNNSIVDIGSNQYPSIAWTREAVKGTMDIKYPFHISEYAHSMGNAVGNLTDYWQAIESTNYFMGGAIWDWVDQSLYNYDSKSGQRYLAFGGDFGDTPTDGQFVMNGIVFGDLSPKPQYYEVKKVYQNVGVTAPRISEGLIDIFNKNYFVSLQDYDVKCSLMRDGVAVKTGNAKKLVDVPHAPRTSALYRLPFETSNLDPDSEYFVNVDFVLNNSTPWADSGYVQMAEQLPLQSARKAPATVNNTLPRAKATHADSTVTIAGQNFTAVFDINAGTLHSLEYNGCQTIVPGHGPTLDAFRAYVNNDNWTSSQWFANGLYNLKHKVLNYSVFTDGNGNPAIATSIQSQAPRGGVMVGGNGNSRGTYSIDETNQPDFGPDDFMFTTNSVWTFLPDGSIECSSDISSSNPNLVLPRLGFSMQTPRSLDTFTYYGRGPVENYADRLTAQNIGLYTANVDSMYTPYTRPQNNGNREQVRWASLTDSVGGLLVVAPDNMSVTVSPYAEMELFKANHTHALPQSTANTLHIDLGMTGLGGASCGQGGPLQQDRVMASPHRFTFILKPWGTVTRTSACGLKPIGIERSRQGIVSINADSPGSQILYTTSENSKPKVYTKPFEMRNGSTITAWLQNTPAVSARAVFKPIKTVAATAIFASSEEPEDGLATFVTDGDPTTMWHTAYSVTATALPHWFDLDLGETKTISEFNYLPRQDGSRTGNIKDYEIYVSDSPDNWPAPVAKGTFENNLRQKNVVLSKPVKGRYVRLKALKAHDGREYATCAEFEVIAR